MRRRPGASRRRTFGPFLLPERRQAGRPGQRRLSALLALSVLAALVFAARLVQLQVVDGEASRRAASQLTSRTVVIPAVRGRILAADGSVLVGNSSTTTLTISPEALRSEKGARDVLTRVAATIGRPVSDLERRTTACGAKGAAPSPVCFSGQPFQDVPIASDVPTEQVNAILERPELYPGIASTTAPTRSYAPTGSSLAQTVGYLTRTTAEDVAAARAAGRASPSSDALLGRAGLEQQYDARLRGVDGQRVVGISPDGRAERVVSTTSAKNGADLRTSIDPTLQKAASDALASGLSAARTAGHRAGSGSVVVMDADTGAIAALTNQPTYDPGVWNGGVTQAEYDALTATAGADPLANRAVSVAGPPASTFKTVSLFAAAATGVDPSGTYDCPSSVVIGNRSFTNFESEAHGRIDIPKALEVSCDTVFYRWAYRNWLDAGGVKAPASTPDPYVLTARRFGFGAPTGVDLPGEAAGAVTDRAAKRRTWEQIKATSCARAERGYPEVKDASRAAYLRQIARENCVSGGVWRPGDAVNFAIGQGDVTATPLQVAGAYATLATGGRRVQPRLVQSDAAPARATGVSLNPAMYAVEREGLRRAISSGTASSAFHGFDLARLPLSGKTGTAEVYGKQPTAWFASYMPAARDGHRYVVVVRVDEGGEGGRTAAPIARRVWDVIARGQHL